MPKQRRLYANENPQKQNAPGHGKVERAKGAMWTTNVEGPTSNTNLLLKSSGKKYQVKETPMMTTLGIGRGGAKKKIAKQTPKTRKADDTSTPPPARGRANPDATFFK